MVSVHLKVKLSRVTRVTIKIWCEQLWRLDFVISVTSFAPLFFYQDHDTKLEKNIEFDHQPVLACLQYNVRNRGTTVQVYNFVVIKRYDEQRASCESRLMEKQEGVPRKEAGRFYRGSLSALLVPHLNFVLLLTVQNGVGLSSAFLPTINSSFRSTRSSHSVIFTNSLSHQSSARERKVGISLHFRYLNWLVTFASSEDNKSRKRGRG